MLLTSTSDIIQIITSSAADIDIQAAWADVTTTAFTPGRTNTKVTSATTTTIIAAPGASTQRQVKKLVIRNIHGATANDVTIQHYDGATTVTVYKATLSAGESIVYTEGGEFIPYDANGVPPVSTGGGGLSDADYGDITVGGSGTTMTIDNAAVTLAKMADLAANSIIGNNTGAGATPLALTAAQVRTLLSLVIGTNAQAWSAVLDTLAGASANGQSLITAANYAAMKALLDLEIGVDVQAYDADLTTWAGLTPSANAQSLVTAADYAAMRTLLGLVIGTNVQAYHAKLADLAGITYAQGDILYFNGTNIVKLSPGTSGQFLKTLGAAANPIWDTIAGGGDALVANPLSQFAATTSAQLRGVLSDENGTGAALFDGATSPTFVTPALGTPSALTLTNATGLPVAGIVASTTQALGVGSLELGHATDTTLSRSAAGVLAVEGIVIPSISSTNTLTNKRVTKRSGSAASSATPTINTDDYDFYHLTAQAADITNFSTNLTGTPVAGDLLHIAITPTATRHIVWGSEFASGNYPLPQFARGTMRLDVFFARDTVANVWRCVGGPATIDLVLAAAVSTAANTTPVDLTDMYFDYEANSYYVFDVYLNAQAPATTTGLSIQANLSTTFNNYGLSVQHIISGSGDSASSSVADDTSVGLTSGFPSTNTPVPVIGSGHLATNGNAGTCQFRLRSETTAVVTVDADSIIVVRKIR